MARKGWILLIFGVFSLYSAQSPSAQQSAPAAGASSSAQSPQQAPLPDEGNIPEEDETEHKETDYHFNPLRAKKELDTGMFYYHKGSYRAAAARFTEATRWDPSFSEAFLRLAEAQLKLKHKDDARKTLGKIVQIAPDSKEAKEARKLSAKL